MPAALILIDLPRAIEDPAWGNDGERGGGQRGPAARPLAGRGVADRAYCLPLLDDIAMRIG
jgi:hypothetical protein